MLDLKKTRNLKGDEYVRCHCTFLETGYNCERNIMCNWKNNDAVSLCLRFSYASSNILLKKKTDETRMCVNYRYLNSKCITYYHPLPRVDDCLEPLRSSKYFTFLNMASGYHQISVLIDKTRFLTLMAIMAT